MNEAFLKLPLAVQIALGGGYLAYLVACAGIRQHHTATDAIFRSLAFGLPATAVLAWAPSYPILRPICAIAASLLAGALWRWRGARWSRELLSASNVSWSDDISTAWLSTKPYTALLGAVAIGDHEGDLPARADADAEAGKVGVVDVVPLRLRLRRLQGAQRESLLHIPAIQSMAV